MPKIVDTSYPAKYLEFKNKFGKATFKSLAEIAANYEYGIDSEQNFYFRPESDEIVERFWIGKGELKSFEPTDEEGKYNCLKVMCGKLTQGENFIVEVKDVPEGQYERWGILELTNAIPSFGCNLTLECSVTTNPVGHCQSNLVDGDNTTAWDSEGDYQQVGHYIQVDLGTCVANLGKVTVDSSEIANVTTDYADGFKILISETGAFTGEETEVFGAPEKKFSKGYVEVTFPAINGRYVRVEITDAKPYYWRVGELEVYAWELADITRWAESQLLLYKADVQKGKLELSNVDRLIMPRGRIEITDKSGLISHDYPIISSKYHLSAQNKLKCDLQLGEVSYSLGEELLAIKRAIMEEKIGGGSRARDLSSSIYTSKGSNQKVEIAEIEAKQIKSINADLSEIIAGNGVITINENGIAAVKIGTTMFNLSAETGGAFFKGNVEAGALVVPVGTDKWAS